MESTSEFIYAIISRSLEGLTRGFTSVTSVRSVVVAPIADKCETSLLFYRI